MINSIIFFSVFIVFVITTVEDLKTRQLSPAWYFVLIFLATMRLMFTDYNFIYAIVSGLIVGFIMISPIIIKNEDVIGGGDIKMMSFFAICMGLKCALITLFIGSIFGTLYQTSIKSRNAPIAFIPFLFIGYIFYLGGLLIGNFI